MFRFTCVPLSIAARVLALLGVAQRTGAMLDLSIADAAGKPLVDAVALLETGRREARRQAACGTPRSRSPGASSIHA